MSTPTGDQKYSFVQKVWITGGIFALIVIVLLLLRATFNVLLLVLAGILIATFFRGLSGVIQKKTKWKEGVCIACSIISTMAVIILLIWMMGAKIQSQAE